VKFVGHLLNLTPSGYLTLAAYHFARHGLSVGLIWNVVTDLETELQ
jgi:hypothetical protein